MALIYYPPQILANAETGLPLVGLKGIAGTVIARGNPASSPVIYEDQAGTAIIAGAGLTVTENMFVRGFYVADTFGRVSFWGDGIEVPLVSEEGNAARQEEIYAEFTDHVDTLAASAQASATASAASATSSAASAASAAAAQTAAENAQAGVADWTKIQNKPGVFPPAGHVHAATDVTSGVFPAARLGTGSTGGTTRYLREDGTYAVPPGSGGSGGSSDWDDITNKPATFTPTTHSHPATQLSDASAHGRGVLTGTTQAASRAAIAAGTSDVTVNGATSGAAAPASHTHTPAQVGLGNVNNTADADKPVSTRQAEALAGKADATHAHALTDVSGLAAALTARAQIVTVSTGSETRPSSSAIVLWIGGATQPAQMAAGDVWLKEV